MPTKGCGGFDLYRGDLTVCVCVLYIGTFLIGVETKNL